MSREPETPAELIRRLMRAIDESQERAESIQAEANAFRDKHVAELKAETAQRFRVTIATELLGDSHFALTNAMDDEPAVRLACRQALAIADILLAEAEVKP